MYYIDWSKRNEWNVTDTMAAKSSTTEYPSEFFSWSFGGAGECYSVGGASQFVSFTIHSAWQSNSGSLCVVF